AMVALTSVPPPAAAAQCRDYWDGTAPFCSGGPCKPGWHAGGSSDYGDGAYCITGHKVLCKCNGGGLPPNCNQLTRTSCVGLLLFCNTGCGWYVCGGCLFWWIAAQQENGTSARVTHLSLVVTALTLL
ncbi:uncharacterized protein EI97DRAFT_489769, partial [Westerdykella ornata]